MATNAYPDLASWLERHEAQLPKLTYDRFSDPATSDKNIRKARKVRPRPEPIDREEPVAGEYLLPEEGDRETPDFDPTKPLVRDKKYDPLESVKGDGREPLLIDGHDTAGRPNKFDSRVNVSPDLPTEIAAEQRIEFNTSKSLLLFEVFLASHDRHSEKNIIRRFGRRLQDAFLTPVEALPKLVREIVAGMNQWVAALAPAGERDSFVRGLRWRVAQLKALRKTEHAQVRGRAAWQGGLEVRQRPTPNVWAQAAEQLAVLKPRPAAIWVVFPDGRMSRWPRTVVEILGGARKRPKIEPPTIHTKLAGHRKEPARVQEPVVKAGGFCPPQPDGVPEFVEERRRQLLDAQVETRPLGAKTARALAVARVAPINKVRQRYLRLENAFIAKLDGLTHVPPKLRQTALILDGLRGGKTLAEIAKALRISRSTVVSRLRALEAK